jgi:hypothetical protein
MIFSIPIQSKNYLTLIIIKILKMENKELIEQLLVLENNYPNDMQLGEKIREFIYKNFIKA